MKEDTNDALPMDQTARPELVTERRIGEPAREPEPVKDEQQPAKIEVDERESSRPRDEQGRFAKAEQTGEKQPDEKPEQVPPTEQTQSVPLKALEDERRKRQEMEQELASIRQQMQSFQQQPQQPEELPEFWDDPTAVIDSRVSSAVETALQRYQQQQQVERVNASEAAARAKHPDYGDAFNAFRAAAQANPALVQQMAASDNPGEFAYSTGKRAMDLERAGSIDELLKQERAKWEAELRAQAPAPSFPQSTVQDGTVAPRGAALPGHKPADITLPMDRRY